MSPGRARLSRGTVSQRPDSNSGVAREQGQRGRQRAVVAAAGPLAHDHVGLQPGTALRPAAAEVLARRREVLAHRDVERTAVVERLDLLEDTLAERARAHELGAPAVLQCARDDLRRRRRPPVHEDDHRHTGRDRVAVGLEHVAGPRASVGDHDRALGDEHARGLDRLVEEATAVAAQVEHDRLRPLAHALGDHAMELVAGALGEVRQAHVGDGRAARVGGAGRHRRHVDLGTGDAPRLAPPARDEGQRDLGAGLALDETGGKARRAPRQRAPVDRHDDIAAAEPGLLGGRMRVDVEHAQPPPFGGDGDADAGEPALGRALERGELLGVEVVREPVVERAHGARQRAVDEVAARDGPVVVALDDVQALVERLLVGVDEEVAQRPGQGAGMAAEPEAHDQRDRHQRAEDGDER
jgi:hypothetical protein